MFETNIISVTETHSYLNTTLLFGLIIFFGTFGARIFQRIHIPQVVGCIVVGILLGDVFDLISPSMVESLSPFTLFALGLIGFMIGGELRSEIFSKYGKQFFIILISQGLGAFLLVAAGTSVVAWIMTGNVHSSIAIGIVLGAIASATAPAATANVLWEYKTRGALTAAVLAIVALDDGLALLLYRSAATGAKALLGTGHKSVFVTASVLLGEIIGAIILGIIAGVLLFYLLKFVKAEDKILEFAISCLLLVVGISMIPGIDPILPAMTFGITVANLMPRQSKGMFKLVQGFSPPVYICFFVLAGAHMELSAIAGWTIVMIVVYTLCRAAGKVAGSWWGAVYSHAPVVVRRYLGICLLPQAGVAIGLAILAGQQFDSEIGHTIIMVVMTATFLMEILGPVMVKVGVKKAGEVGMNVTEEDLIKSYTVKDVMDSKPPIIPGNMPLDEILETFSATDNLFYPVVDKQNHITGVITIADIKEMFANRDVAGWLLACDVAEPVLDKTTADRPLESVFEHMRQYELENIPVVSGDDNDRLLGLLDYRLAQRKISAEVLQRRKQADGLPGLAV